MEGFLVQGIYPCGCFVWLARLYAFAQVVMMEVSPLVASLSLDQGTSSCCRPGLDGNLAPVVRKVDNVIHWINHYPADSLVCFIKTYPLDSDLSSG